MSKYKIGLTMLLAIWHLTATSYYGWNFLPASEQEIFFDAIAVIGMILIWKEQE